MVNYIPYMCCGTQSTETWLWMVCNKCGYAYVYPASNGIKVLLGTTEKNAASALTAILME